MPKAATVIKKRWIPILAPKLFNEAEIGETYVADPATVKGRDITVSLMTLTNDPQKQAINVHFKIVNVEADKAHTEFLGYRILPAALKRFVRRNRDKFEDSFIIKTKDDVLVRLKPFVVTRTRCTGGTLAILRRVVRTHIGQATARMTYDQLTEELLTHKLQNDTGALMRKVFPVGSMEIKWMERAPKDAVPITVDMTIEPFKPTPRVRRNEQADQGPETQAQADEQPTSQETREVVDQAAELEQAEAEETKKTEA